MVVLVKSALSAAQRRLLLASNIGRREQFSALLTPVEEFPGLPTVEPTPSKASTASVTKLSNGVTVVTEDASSSSTVSMTFPQGGSSSEALSQQQQQVGAALVNGCLNFKSGSELSTALILRNLEDDGALAFATSSRHAATVGYTAAPDKAQRLVPLLMVDCSFEAWDVVEARKAAQAAAQDADANVQSVLESQLYAAAYGPQSPLGKSHYVTGTSLDGIMQFRKDNYGLNGAVLAATGIANHAEFVAAVEEGFAEANPGKSNPPISSPYMGGEARLWAPSSGYAHLAVALCLPPGTFSTALQHVLQVCLRLGGGGGGVSSFSLPGGLVGLYAGGPSAEPLTDAIVAAWHTKPTAAVVQRAKILAKAETLLGLENGGSRELASAMTASVLTAGDFSTASVAAAYDAITDKDVTTAYTALLKSNPAVATVGDIAIVPYHATIAASLK